MKASYVVKKKKLQGIEIPILAMAIPYIRKKIIDMSYTFPMSI